MSYRPRDYGVPRRKAFGTSQLSGWRIPEDQDLEDGLRAVAAAAVQHELAVLVRRRLGQVSQEGITPQKVAAKAGISNSAFSKKLNGEVGMGIEDLVWMADIGVVVPGPEQLQEIARRAVRSATITGQPGPGPRIGGSHFDPGFSFRPVLPEDRPHRSGVAAAAALASMGRLSAVHWTVDAAGVQGADLRLLTDERPDVDGSVLCDEVCARLWLSASWDDDVARGGLTTIGDRFVAQVLEWDGDRPTRALLLRVLPRPFTAGSIPDDPVWALSPATLTADGFHWDEPDELSAAACWDAY